MSAKNPKKITAETYVVLVPVIRGSGDWRYVASLRVDRTRTQKPSLARGEIAIKVRLHFDELALLDSIPVIDMDVTGFQVASPDPIAADTSVPLDA